MVSEPTAVLAPVSILQGPETALGSTEGDLVLRSWKIFVKGGRKYWRMMVLLLHCVPESSLRGDCQQSLEKLKVTKILTSTEKLQLYGSQHL